ncbi:MAG: glycosyltransferase family 2 protein [Candidatus Dormiibacterota bacterium]
MTVRIGAVIPALDEEAAIGEVVAGLRATGLLDELVVVDNGSRDRTGSVAEAAGARVVREDRRGYGRACLTGVLALRSEIVVLLDGDAADDPADLRRVLEPLLEGDAELVVGSRSLGPAERGSMTQQQVLGNRLAAFLIGRLHDCRVSDLGPFRAIRRADLLALDLQEMTYGWSVEMVVKAARAGYRYREVPVSYHRRIGTSKVGGTIRGSVRAGVRILTTVVRYTGWRPAPAEVAA